ncbi:MAG: hypothetical protein PHY72_00935 [Candidatus Pacebacteria bacterium]|nr:hypothetical protein [Candidatus Paceibacterota bacterium]
MCWCFAIVNNKLAEIFFDEKKNSQMKIWGHCYVEREDYKTKTEQKYIEKDISKVRVVYRNKKYKIVKPKISHN